MQMARMRLHTHQRTEGCPDVPTCSHVQTHSVHVCVHAHTPLRECSTRFPMAVGQAAPQACHIISPTISGIMLRGCRASRATGLPRGLSQVLRMCPTWLQDKSCRRSAARFVTGILHVPPPTWLQDKSCHRSIHGECFSEDHRFYEATHNGLDVMMRRYLRWGMVGSTEGGVGARTRGHEWGGVLILWCPKRGIRKGA